MKNIISVMLFMIAFSINANAQQSDNAVKKENCCAMQCDMACCDDASCTMGACDMASCDMTAANCPMAAPAGCTASAADKASVDNTSAAPAVVATQPAGPSGTAGKTACCGSKEPVRKA